MATKLERDFETDFIDDLERLFPGCEIIKGASMYRQGIPDRIMFYEDFYAFFELKRSARAAQQPNQGWYVEKFDSWSFAAFVYPENKNEVLDAVREAFESRGTARVS